MLENRSESPDREPGETPASHVGSDGSTSWNAVAQTTTAVLLAVGLALAAWRGWSLSRFSTQPLTLQRGGIQHVAGTPIQSPSQRKTRGPRSEFPHGVEAGSGYATRQEIRHRGPEPSETFQRLQQRLKNDGMGSASSRSAAPAIVRASPGKKKAPSGVVDMNRASREELQGLPGIGPTLAQRIVEARPFRSVEDLRRVRGIGPKTLEKLRPLVGIGEDASAIRVTVSGNK